VTRHLTHVLLALSIGLTGLAIADLHRAPDGLHPARFAPWIARIDLNDDARVDRLEFRQVAAGGPSFEVYDLDRDGSIDVSELEQAMRNIDPMWLYEDPK